MLCYPSHASVTGVIRSTELVTFKDPTTFKFSFKAMTDKKADVIYKLPIPLTAEARGVEINGMKISSNGCTQMSYDDLVAEEIPVVRFHSSLTHGHVVQISNVPKQTTMDVSIDFEIPLARGSKWCCFVIPACIGKATNLDFDMTVEKTDSFSGVYVGSGDVESGPNGWRVRAQKSLLEPFVLKIFRNRPEEPMWRLERVRKLTILMESQQNQRGRRLERDVIQFIKESSRIDEIVVAKFGDSQDICTGTSQNQEDLISFILKVPTSTSRRYSLLSSYSKYVTNCMREFLSNEYTLIVTTSSVPLEVLSKISSAFPRVIFVDTAHHGDMKSVSLQAGIKYCHSLHVASIEETIQSKSNYKENFLEESNYKENFLCARLEGLVDNTCCQNDDHPILLARKAEKTHTSSCGTTSSFSCSKLSHTDLPTSVVVSLSKLIRSTVGTTPALS